MPESVPVDPSAAPAAARLRAVWLGRREFAEVLDLQLRARDALLDGSGEPTLFLVEHPAVLTIGRRGSRDDILWTDAELAAQGVAVAMTPRGGQVTLHAPGQLVCYPVVEVGRQIRHHLVELGETTIELLTELGVESARFRMEHPGVWVDDAKVASIGVHISRGVAIQGLSVNLDVDATLFAALVSCGLRGVDVVSARHLGGRSIAVADAAHRWAEIWARRAGVGLDWAD
jgi:lipoyl(octanoyl) transferase